MDKKMVAVNLDIAGFYYAFHGAQVEEGAPVIELMKAVRGKAAANGAVLDFDGEPRAAPVNLDSITVTHEGMSAVSRQKSPQADDGTFSPSNRTYPDGIYAAADEAVFFLDSTSSSPLVAADRNKTGVMTWQYYVYDSNQVDLNRKGGPRKLVPFTKVFDRLGESVRGLQEGDTVVWRLIMIRTRPDGGLGDGTVQMDGTVFRGA
ncbi:MAG: hypothetical protein AAF771_17480 [Pseudomonadota bacterium]